MEEPIIISPLKEIRNYLGLINHLEGNVIDQDFAKFRSRYQLLIQHALEINAVISEHNQKESKNGGLFEIALAGKNTIYYCEKIIHIRKQKARIFRREQKIYNEVLTKLSESKKDLSDIVEKTNESHKKLEEELEYLIFDPVP